MNFERVETTFFEDFKIAIPFGIKAIKDTYNRALYSVKMIDKDYKIFTELVMALNHLSWRMHEIGEYTLGDLFADLYYKAEDEFYKTFGENKEACRFFYKITN